MLSTIPILNSKMINYFRYYPNFVVISVLQFYSSDRIVAALSWELVVRDEKMTRMEDTQDTRHICAVFENLCSTWSLDSFFLLRVTPSPAPFGGFYSIGSSNIVKKYLFYALYLMELMFVRINHTNMYNSPRLSFPPPTHVHCTQEIPRITGKLVEYFQNVTWFD